jgi:hypothetical protein
MSEAVNVLSNHKFDSHNNLNNNRNDQSRNDTSEDQQVPSLSFSQLEGKCYCCGSSEHMSPGCLHKNRPISKWYMKIVRVLVNSLQQSSDNVSVTTNQSSITESVPAETPRVGTITEDNGWQGYHVRFDNITEI